MSAEIVGPFLGMVAGADHHEHGQVVAEGGHVDVGVCPADQAGRVQSLQPAPAGILRQPDALGQITLRDRAVLLQA